VGESNSGKYKLLVISWFIQVDPKKIKDFSRTFQGLHTNPETMFLKIEGLRAR
jgi:hypothetical protein